MEKEEEGNAFGVDTYRVAICAAAGIGTGAGGGPRATPGPRTLSSGSSVLVAVASIVEEVYITLLRRDNAVAIAVDVRGGRSPQHAVGVACGLGSVVRAPDHPGAWEKQVLSAGGVQAGRKALRIRHKNGMEVRKKRPRGFKKEAQGVQVSPLNPLSVAPCSAPPRRGR